MASLGDVLSVLAQNVSDAVYPNGLLQPSVAGVDTTILSGWAVRNVIDEILIANKALISVFPTSKVKIVTKFERVYQEISQTAATLTATVVGNIVTIGGVVTIPQAVMLVVDGVGYAYQVLITDTLDDIAANLAALIPGATPLNADVVLDNPYSVTASITTAATAAYELSRQERVFLIRCWTTSPQVRDALMNAIDIAFKINYRIVLPDQFYGLVFPIEAPDAFMDSWEKSLMLIGNLQYKVQYPITVTDEFYTITDTNQSVSVVNQIQ